MYTIYVKNLTLTAEENLIDRARLRAANEHRTLNAAFREWLERYAAGQAGQAEYLDLMKQFGHIKTARAFSRDEMNAR